MPFVAFPVRRRHKDQFPVAFQYRFTFGNFIFAGLLFASEFRSVDSPAAALGANMLGAVVGGLLENLSLIIGMKALLLVAALLYSLAALGFLGLPSRSAAAAQSRHL